jgi:hypothetical protein
MGWVQRAVYGVCLVLLGRECFEATIWQAELRGLVVMHTIRLYELAFKLEVITTTHEQLFTSMVGFVLSQGAFHGLDEQLYSQMVYKIMLLEDGLR